MQICQQSIRELAVEGSLPQEPGFFPLDQRRINPGAWKMGCVRTGDYHGVLGRVEVEHLRKRQDELREVVNMDETRDNMIFRVSCSPHRYLDLMPRNAP
jgi:hypothetical protein